MGKRKLARLSNISDEEIDTVYKVQKLNDNYLDESSEYDSADSGSESQQLDELKDDDNNKNNKEKEFDFEESESADETNIEEDNNQGYKLEKFGIDKEDDESSNSDEQDEEDKLFEQMNNSNDISAANRLKEKDKEYARARAKQKRLSAIQINLEQALTQLSFFFTNSQDTIIQTLGRLNSTKKQFEKVKKDEVVYLVNSINYITNLLSVIQNKGFEENIYDLQLPRLLECIDEETLNKEEALDYQKTPFWNFKRLDKPTDAKYQTHTTYEMDYWNKTFFKNNVVVKFDSSDDIPNNWFHIITINFGRK